MLLTQFILENFHFGLNVFTAFVFFAVAWLYLDAWIQEHSINSKDILKIFGFLTLSISFLIHSVFIEQQALTGQFLNFSLVETIGNVFRVAGYILIIAELLMDPIEKKPKTQTSTPAGFAGSIGASFWQILSPVLSFFVFILYFRKAIIGLEKHLKPIAFGFLFVFLYEAVSAFSLLSSLEAISIYRIVSPFGPVWIVSHLLLLAGVIIIGKWVFQYLLERIQTELFMILNTVILVVFLVVTVIFTGILIKNLQDEALNSLKTDANVVKYAVDAKVAEALSNAQLVAQNSQIQQAILDNNTELFKKVTQEILIAKKQSFLIITSSTGQVLMRGEDSEKIGDSLSSDTLFKKATRGEEASGVVVTEGAASPIVSIRAGVAVKSEDVVIGTVIMGIDIDNAFLDGVKKQTGLEVSVYGANALSATTFVGEDGKSRFLGVKEDNKNVVKTVLSEGKIYSGEESILNVPYFVVFSPLFDVDNNSVAMLFVGKEQSSAIQAASNAIEFTFIAVVFLLLISVFVTFIISRFIGNQFK